MKLVHLCHEACAPCKRPVKLIYRSDAVHYIVKGYGVFNGRTLGPGMGFVCRSGQAVMYYPRQADPWEYYWVRVEGDDLAPFFDSIRADSDGVFRHALHEELQGLYAMMTALDQPKYASLKSSAFPELFKKLHRPDATQPQPASRFYTERVKQMIDAHLHEPVRIGAIADRLHLNRSYLRNLFVTEEGISPCQYRQKKRMETAAQLLRETTYSVGTIANSVGYEDQLLFSRAFKKAYSVAPTVYRQQES